MNEKRSIYVCVCVGEYYWVESTWVVIKTGKVLYDLINIQETKLSRKLWTLW